MTKRVPELHKRRRVFTAANTVSVVAGIVVFFFLTVAWRSVAGALAAAVTGGVAAAAIWYGWNRFLGKPPVRESFDEPNLAAIPSTPGIATPSLTEPESDAAHAYIRALERLDAESEARIVLVSGPAPGHGATTVALNLAIAATRIGKRVVLVDGDPSSRGLSRFGHTGPVPGLSELAAGTTTLAEASRLWSLEPGQSVPFIPSGAPNGRASIAGEHLEGVMGRLAAGSELVLIDTPPVEHNGNGIARHADGTVIVVTETAAEAEIQEARHNLMEAGAPVVGYVINRADHGGRPRSPWPRMLRRGITTLVLSLLLFAGWNAYQVWDSWRTVERDALDVAVAEQLLPLPAGGFGLEDEEYIPEDVTAVVTASPTAEGDIQSLLIIGADRSGLLADVMILTLLVEGRDPVMVSLPRDLYLPNRCTQSFDRLNANLAGCTTAGAEINGPTMLALAVEDFTGVPVDHFALFNFDGFSQIIDEVGGVEICVERPVRDRKSDLNLPAGCTLATGDQALSWVRSRHTQELVGSSWRTVPGVSDLTRNERQQEVILSMFAKLRDFESPAEFSAAVEGMTSAFTLDEGLGIAEAIGLAWSLRDLDPGSVERIVIPVENYVAPGGAQVLLPTVAFHELLASVFPELTGADMNAGIS